MLKQYGTLIILLAALVILTVIWIFSFQAVYRNIRQRNLGMMEQSFWITLTFILPIIGQCIYHGVRIGETWALTPLPLKKTSSSKKSKVLSSFEKSTKELLLEEDQKAEPVENNQPDTLPGVCILEIVEGSDRGRIFEICNLPGIIGRDPQADVILQGDRSISRKHAMILENNGKLLIRDMESRHGTLVNGFQAHEQPLKTGDRISMGTTVLIVQSIARMEP